MQADHYKNDDSTEEDNSAEKLKCVCEFTEYEMLWPVASLKHCCVVREQAYDKVTKLDMNAERTYPSQQQ